MFIFDRIPSNKSAIKLIYDWNKKNPALGGININQISKLFRIF